MIFLHSLKLKTQYNHCTRFENIVVKLLNFIFVAFGSVLNLRAPVKAQHSLGRTQYSQEISFSRNVCINKGKRKYGFEDARNKDLRDCKITHSHNNIQILNEYLPQYVLLTLLSLNFNSCLFTTSGIRAMLRKP